MEAGNSNRCPNLVGLCSEESIYNLLAHDASSVLENVSISYTYPYRLESERYEMTTAVSPPPVRALNCSSGDDTDESELGAYRPGRAVTGRQTAGSPSVSRLRGWSLLWVRIRAAAKVIY
jgi:hypothetical protein